MAAPAPDYFLERLRHLFFFKRLRLQWAKSIRLLNPGFRPLMLKQYTIHILTSSLKSIYLSILVLPEGRVCEGSLRYRPGVCGPPRKDSHLCLLTGDCNRQKSKLNKITSKFLTNLISEDVSRYKTW